MNSAQPSAQEQKPKPEESKSEMQELYQNAFLNDEFMEMIKKEVEDSSPNVSDIQSIDILEKEFENNEIFKKKI